MAKDDPIVYPGQPGMSHLHVFFGNTATNAFSTAETIRTQGNSTCRGGVSNRSSYWIPAMIDTTTGAPLTPDEPIFYYKQGYVISPSSAIQKLPEGLRMIAGDASNATASGGAWRYACLDKTFMRVLNDGKQIPVCPAGSVSLQIEVFFPQCWDGRNLDSPDHKSHMAYPVQFKCPSTHPVALPEITFVVGYPLGAGNTTKWRLSSDTYPANLPAGYSMHADWFNGWKRDVSDSWAKNCIEKSLDCGAHLVGDGRELY